MRFVSILFAIVFMACATARPVTESSKITASALTPTVITSNEPVVALEPCRKIELTAESDYCQTEYAPTDRCYIPVCGCPEPAGYKPVVGSDGKEIHACLMKPRAEK